MRRNPLVQRAVTALTGGVAAVALVLGTAACGGEDPQVQAKAVSSSYEQFAEAVAAKDGDKAAGLLATPSLSYFDGIRASALDADRKKLATLPVLDQITVLSFRGNLKPEVLRSSDPAQLVSAAVKADAITGGSSPQQPLRDVKVDGDAATAVLTLGTEDSTQTQTIHFSREDDTWKFDLTSLFVPATEQLKSIQKSTGFTQAKLVRMVAQDRYGKRTDQLYQPVGRS